MNPSGLLAIAVELDAFATPFKPVINAIVGKEAAIVCNDEDRPRRRLMSCDRPRRHGICMCIVIDALQLRSNKMGCNNIMMMYVTSFLLIYASLSIYYYSSNYSVSQQCLARTLLTKQ
jgi:hypothetical protein